MRSPTSTKASSFFRSLLRRWSRRLLIFLLVGLLAFLFRTPLLRTTARILISEDGSPSCTRIAIRSGDRRYEYAAIAIAETRAAGVLMVESTPNRLELLGLLPPSAEIDRRELKQRGVTGDRIEMVPGRARSAWDWGRQLGTWLNENPETTILVLSDRFSSRRDRLILRQALTPEHFARVRIAALPHRDHDETNWWHDKDGVLDFAHRFLGLTHVWLSSEPDPGPELATVDELEGRGK